MPQIHFVASRESALKTSIDKIFGAPDGASALISAHLIIEALLHTFVRKKVADPTAIDAAVFAFGRLSACHEH